MAQTDTPKFFSYKGKPLVRNGNIIYYGDMSDEYVVMMQIKSNKKRNDVELADDISIQLMMTDPDAPPQDRIVKTSQKKGLYNALDIASVWLTRALTKK